MKKLPLLSLGVWVVAAVGALTLAYAEAPDPQPGATVDRMSGGGQDSIWGYPVLTVEGNPCSLECELRCELVCDCWDDGCACWWVCWCFCPEPPGPFPWEDMRSEASAALHPDMTEVSELAPGPSAVEVIAPGDAETTLAIDFVTALRDLEVTSDDDSFATACAVDGVEPWDGEETALLPPDPEPYPEPPPVLVCCGCLTEPGGELGCAACCRWGTPVCDCAENVCYCEPPSGEPVEPSDVAPIADHGGCPPDCEEVWVRFCGCGPDGCDCWWELVCLCHSEPLPVSSDPQQD